MVYVSVPNFISIGLFCRPLAAKPLSFAVFGLQHLVASPVGGNLRKLNTGAQLQTFPYPTVSKSFLYSNAFMAKSGAISDVHKRDGQTNEKHQRFWPPGWWNPSPIKLGMVIEDLEHVLALLKLLGSDAQFRRWIHTPRIKSSTL